MNKYNIEATDKNVLKSIEKDKLQRTRDVIDFIGILETIDYNSFISLDGAWGDGKTFLVRQIEMTLKYHNKINFEKEITIEEKNAFSSNKQLGELELQHAYLPIYYNAWLYDNHSSALMSLLMVTIKNYEKFVNTKIGSSKGEKVASIMDSVQFWKSSNWQNLREIFVGKDILSEAYLLEEIRDMIKEIFGDLIEERGKLVIFVDELDRCKPTFAVEILESIKHYFDDERIIFVMSVNKSQLIHTISKYYGNNFDSSSYLNKFFDMNIQLPQANTVTYFNSLGISCDDSYWIKKFANELQKYYSLSLRDTTKYFQKIVSIHEKYQGKIGTDTWRVVVLFIPVLCVLDIIDVTKKCKFLSGKGFDILEELIFNIGDMKKYILKITGKTEDTQENYCACIEELKRIYEFGFCSDKNYGWFDGCLDIHSGLKNECLRICNSI